MTTQYKKDSSKILLHVGMTTWLGSGDETQAETKLPASWKVSLKRRHVPYSPSLLWMQTWSWESFTNSLTQEEELGFTMELQYLCFLPSDFIDEREISIYFVLIYCYFRFPITHIQLNLILLFINVNSEKLFIFTE